MASRNSTTIPPFPTDINRHDFAKHISGFTAGEGCFMLWNTANGGKSRFCIRLRDDDREALELIQSYFQCGNVTDHVSHQDQFGKNPQSMFAISDMLQNWNVIVPHFDQHPMFAKKQKDFLIWRRGIEFLITRRIGRPRNNAGRVQWTSKDRETFNQLVNKLSNCKKYRPNNPSIRPDIIPDELPPPHETQGGFLFPD